MTNITNLIREWEHSAGGRLTARRYAIHLPMQDAARIAALAEMYPRRSESELISELLSASLDELANAMPYIPGDQVVSEDEAGNPIYEDIGPTPRFLALSSQYLQKMEGAGSAEA